MAAVAVVAGLAGPGAAQAAAEYEFQLSADQKFSSIVLGKGRGLGSQRTRNTAATLHKTVPDGKYYWRVRAISKRDRVGRWSKPRILTKSWKTAPALQAPNDEHAVTWPSLPLVLRWSPVPHATHYLVTVATDPSLAQSVIDVRNRPVETQGTVFALQGTLPAGRYYWAITPVDAGGLRGTRSRVGSFTWQWPTSTATSVTDLNDSDRVFDPLLNWKVVPGAARYEVEINPDDDFAAGSRVCCKDRVIGTSLSPLRLLPNNNDFGTSGYHWRVRAFDVDDNPGQWNVGPTFEKAYDNVPETIPNLRLRDPALTELAPSAATATARRSSPGIPCPARRATRCSGRSTSAAAASGARRPTSAVRSRPPRPHGRRCRRRPGPGTPPCPAASGSRTRCVPTAPVHAPASRSTSSARTPRRPSSPSSGAPPTASACAP